MVKSQVDPVSGEYYPPFGVGGGSYDEAAQDYKKYRTDDMEHDALFLIKANAPINTEAYSYAQTQLSSGKIHMLIDEREAKVKLMSTKVGQNMTPEERNERMKPFVQTTILKEQMLNLIEDNEGVNIILKPNNKSIKHDKFSAFIYGLYYIKTEEERKKRHRTRDIKQFMFMN